MTNGQRSGSNRLGVYLLPVFGAVALVVFTIIMLLGLIVVGGVIGALDTAGSPYNTTASPNPTIAQPVNFETTWGSAEILEVYSVRDTTNTSVKLTGANDSYIESKQPFSIASDDTWTVCTWANVGAGAQAKTMTALSANGRVLLQYNGSQGNWSAWYYDDGSRNSWRVNVAAPNQPGNFTNVCAWHNSTHFGIQRNVTAGESVNTSAAAGSSIADSWATSSNWDGRLDESRGFDNSLNSSQYAALHNYGVLPLTNATRTFRITYDEGHGSTTAVYFAGTSADISNGTWAGGLNGTRLDAGTDYELNAAKGTITALSGGMIDGAPVVWIAYRYKPLNRVGKLGAAITPAFQLAASAGLVIPAVVVLAMLLGGVLAAVKVVKQTDYEDASPFRRRRGRGR